jgi:hypothetical protein
MPTFIALTAMYIYAVLPPRAPQTLAACMHSLFSLIKLNKKIAKCVGKWNLPKRGVRWLRLQTN